MLDERLVPLAVELRDAIARENARLGRHEFSPATLFWHELVGPNGTGDSLLELRRRQLRAMGLLD